MTQYNEVDLASGQILLVAQIFVCCKHLKNGPPGSRQEITVI